MDDQFLHQFREAPSQTFGEGLYEQLKQLEQEETMTTIHSLQLHSELIHTPLRRQRQPFMTLAAALVAVVMLGVIMHYEGHSTPSLVSTPPPPLRNLPVITRENAGQLVEIKRLGNGSLDQPVWSPDGQTLAVAGARGVWLFQAANLEAPPRLLETHRGSGGAIPTVDYSSDGRLIAASDGNAIRVWNAQTGEVTALLEGHTSPVMALAFSPDSQLLASGSGTIYDKIPDYSVRLWNLATGQGQVLGEGKQFVTNVAFSPDGTQLAADFYDGNAILWDIQSGQERRRIQRETHFDTGLAFSPDGKGLVLGEAQGIGLWDTETGERMAQAKAPDEIPNVRDIVFTPTGQQVIFSTVNAGILVWDIAKRGFIDHPKLAGLSVYSRMSFSPDGKTLALVSWDSKLILWDFDADAEIAAIRDYMGTIWSLTLHGNQAAYGSSHIIEMLNLESGELVRQIDSDLDRLSAVRFSTDGNILYYSGSKSLQVRSNFAMDQVGIRRVNAGTGEQLPTLGGDFYNLYGLALSPDGRWLAGANANNDEVRLWDLSQEPLKNAGDQLLQTPNHSYNNVVFTPDSRLLVMATQQGDVATRNLETQELIVLQEGEPGWRIFEDNLAINPDGKTLAVAYGTTKPDDKSSVQIVDIETGEILRALEHDATNPFLDVAFSQDGQLLAALTEEQMFVWDVMNGKVVAVTPKNAEVTSVAFDAEGHYIVTGGADGLVRVWGALPE